MIKEVTVCDYCGKQTEDIYDTVGWITLHGLKLISISGGRNKDNLANSFRFITNNNVNNIHFCCLECMIQYIYLKNGYFNGNGCVDLAIKLDSIDVDENREKVQKIAEKVQLFCGLADSKKERPFHG